MPLIKFSWSNVFTKIDFGVWIGTILVIEILYLISYSYNIVEYTKRVISYAKYFAAKVADGGNLHDVHFIFLIFLSVKPMNSIHLYFFIVIMNKNNSMKLFCFIWCKLLFLFYEWSLTLPFMCRDLCNNFNPVSKNVVVHVFNFLMNGIF